ncbi:THUMP domain-containing protein [Candidatus Bathyarchaeota archaeon]|nr:THUMP domain-containing protein [Candidatus Bathyarchaeota archaeon]
MAKLFCLLSGEHEDLPTSELKAILEAETCPYTVLEKLDQLLRIDSIVECTKAITHRAALTRLLGLELFNCKAELKTILRTLNSTNLEEVLDEQSFEVRIKRVKSYSPKIDTLALERKLGELILNKTPQAKVKLTNPDKTFVGILTDERFVFGLKLAEIKAKPFVERRPRRRPFFHPSAMQAKLARCMVNLAEPKQDSLVLDPLCGTGSMLVEASLIGCRVVGLDVQRRMVRGTIRNLVSAGAHAEGVIVADARNLPLKKIDCVVTDPPYGISSTTMKRTTLQIVEELLKGVYGLMDSGQRICLASPKTLKVARLGAALGYKHLESHFVYVHRSLTREIVVFEKV